LQIDNSHSTGTLSSLSFWAVDVVVETACGRPIAMMKSFSTVSPNAKQMTVELILLKRCWIILKGWRFEIPTLSILGTSLGLI